MREKMLSTKYLERENISPDIVNPMAIYMEYMEYMAISI